MGRFADFAGPSPVWATLGVVDLSCRHSGKTAERTRTPQGRGSRELRSQLPRIS